MDAIFCRPRSLLLHDREKRSLVDTILLLSIVDIRF
jgi:hypothetical protein